MDIIKRIGIVFLLGILVMPLGVGAQGQGLPGSGGVPEQVSDIDQPGELINLIDTVVDWIFTILLIAAVLMVIVAAFQFVTAGGSSEAVNSARMKIMWAIVGILLAFGAQAIPTVIANLLGDL